MLNRLVVLILLDFATLDADLVVESEIEAIEEMMVQNTGSYGLVDLLNLAHLSLSLPHRILWRHKAVSFSFELKSASDTAAVLQTCQELNGIASTISQNQDDMYGATHVIYGVLAAFWWSFAHRHAEKYVRKGRLDWPEGATSRESIKVVLKLPSLHVSIDSRHDISFFVFCKIAKVLPLVYQLMTVKKTSFPEMKNSGSIVVNIPEIVKD
ncbi:hypothetical protein Tco_0587901 [Tanacetum coccineum]